MNAANPAAIPLDIAPPAPRAKPIEPPVRLLRLVLGLAFAIGTFDLCFWGISSLGFSLAVFSLVLAGIILGNRGDLRPNRVTRVLLALLLGAAFASAIETGVTNTLVLIVLIVALAGQTFFTGTESIWGRCLSQGVALMFAPGRPFWLAARMMEAIFRGGVGSVGNLVGGVLLAVPALILAVVFGSLLAAGNTVFGAWTSNFFAWFWNELALCFDAGRITLWLLAAFVMLPLLRPSLVSEGWWRWTERLPRLPEIVPARGAFFSSGLVLLVLNVMFFIANVADAVFLWSGDTKLPAGVTYSGYVHNGVNALTITVILSAVILTIIFQQSVQVAARRELKVLALVWIAQNLFLLTSVALRLKLYIEAYDMTVERLSVIIFLLLVASGFGLLTVKIVKDRSLSWLIGGCALAVIATLYITQFLNLAGWSAEYNVLRWEKNPSRQLDGTYLASLGPAAWPSIHDAYVSDSTYNDHLKAAWDIARVDEETNPRSEFDSQHWREFSLRAYLNRWALEEKPNN